MPGESHPLEALLAVLRAGAADELEEVIPLQVAGLLPPQLAWWTTGRRVEGETGTQVREVRQVGGGVVMVR